jgi:hypothetical protein
MSMPTPPSTFKVLGGVGFFCTGRAKHVNGRPVAVVGQIVIVVKPWV